MTTHEQPRERDELARLVAAAREGDRPAFDELVRRTYVDTYTLALRLTAHEEDARDVVQESYLRAWKGLPRFRGDAQFSTWMYRITANTAYTRSSAAAVIARSRSTRCSRTRSSSGPARSPRTRRSRPRSSSGCRSDSSELPPKLPRARRAERRLRTVARGDRRGARHLGAGGQGSPPSRSQAPPRSSLRRRFQERR